MEQKKAAKTKSSNANSNGKKLGNAKQGSNGTKGNEKRQQPQKDSGKNGAKGSVANGQTSNSKNGTKRKDANEANDRAMKKVKGEDSNTLGVSRQNADHHQIGDRAEGEDLSPAGRAETHEARVRTQLRQLEQPITLFGESDTDREARLLRLQARINDGMMGVGARAGKRFVSGSNDANGNAIGGGAGNSTSNNNASSLDEFGSIYKDTETRLQEEELRRKWVGVHTMAEVNSDIQKALRMKSANGEQKKTTGSNDTRNPIDPIVSGKNDTDNDELVLYMLKNCMKNLSKEIYSKLEDKQQKLDDSRVNSLDEKLVKLIIDIAKESTIYGQKLYNELSYIPYKYRDHPLLDDRNFMAELKESEVIPTDVDTTPFDKEKDVLVNKIFKSLSINKKLDITIEKIDKNALVELVRNELNPQRLCYTRSILYDDPNLTQDLLIVFIKRLLRNWKFVLDESLVGLHEKDNGGSNKEEEIDNPTENEFDGRKTPLDSNAASIRKRLATQYQCQMNVETLLIHLKERKISKDILENLVKVSQFIQFREYMKANDYYLRLSIGNAPWPIGVTMVGIHERSARERISSSKVAHALNDETQRKWIQTLKRLMTLSQKIWPPKDLAKLVG